MHLFLDLVYFGCSCTYLPCFSILFCFICFIVFLIVLLCDFLLPNQQVLRAEAVPLHLTGGLFQESIWAVSSLSCQEDSEIEEMVHCASHSLRLSVRLCCEGMG